MDPIHSKVYSKSWEYNSIVHIQHLLSMYKTLGSLPTPHLSLSLTHTQSDEHFKHSQKNSKVT